MVQNAKATPHVLICEDDAPNRLLLQTFLARRGFRVDCATNGADALRLISSNNYDAILLDLMLPVLNGFEVLRRLGWLGSDALRRVVVITAVADRLLDDLQSQHRSISGVLRKPFDLNELAAAIESCTSGASSPPIAMLQNPRRAALSP